VLLSHVLRRAPMAKASHTVKNVQYCAARTGSLAQSLSFKTAEEPRVLLYLGSKVAASRLCRPALGFEVGIEGTSGASLLHPNAAVPARPSQIYLHIGPSVRCEDITTN